MVWIGNISHLYTYYGYIGTEQPGIYRSKQPLLEKIQVIVLNQLQPTLHNAFVQCFASQRKVYQDVLSRIQSIDQEQLSYSIWQLVAGLGTQRNRKG